MTLKWIKFVMVTRRTILPAAALLRLYQGESLADKMNLICTSKELNRNSFQNVLNEAETIFYTLASKKEDANTGVSVGCTHS